MLPQNTSSEGMKIMSVCPVCNVQYNPMQAKIIDEVDEARLVFIQCARCSSSVVAVIVNAAFGVTSVGLITDLNADEVYTFKDTEPINADDVIAVHQSLKKNASLLPVFNLVTEDMTVLVD